MIPDMIHTPYIAPHISVMAPPPVTAERFVDELLSGLCMPDGGFVAHLAPSGDPFSNGWNAAMKLQASQPTSCCLPMPVNVIFHNPATIVFWDDGDKTVVKCQPGDTFSAEAGLTAAMLKKYMGNVMRSGAKGVKIMVSGRLDGAEIARSEHYHEGSIPLQTLRADIDYGFAEAHTTFGVIGVKVWIYKGEVLPKANKAPKAGGNDNVDA